MNTEGSSNKTQGCLAAGTKKKKRKKSKQAQLFAAMQCGAIWQRAMMADFNCLPVGQSDKRKKKNITVTTL